MRVINLTRNHCLAETVREARTFPARLRGWLGTQPPGEGEGLYLTPCAWVHTLGLGWALDAVYVNRAGLVLAVRTLAPQRVGPWVPAARGVLELRAGVCAGGACCQGDRLLRTDGGW